MGINDIELPEFILAELYKNTLLYAPDASTAIPARPVGKPAPAAIPSASPVSAAPAPAAITSTPPAAAPAPTPPASAPAPAAAPVSVSPVAVTPDNPAAPYKFLGNNRRKITILVASPHTAFLPDDQLTFLTKILEACQMTIGDVAIVNQARTPVVISTLRQQLQPTYILLFGVDTIAIRLPIQFPEFKIQEYDQCTYLSAPPLAELVSPTHEGKVLKSKLWVSLKTMFNV